MKVIPEPHPLRELLLNNGIELEEFAERLGCDSERLDRILSGTAIASPDLAYRLDRLYHQLIQQEEEELVTA